MTGSIAMSSGALIYSSQAGGSDNARHTGYKMNDGQSVARWILNNSRGGLKSRPPAMR